MVKINQKQMVSDGKSVRPFMHVHNLTVKKNAPTFAEGENVNCYIAEYDNGRFAVFSSSGVQNTKYHVFDSETELHEHFDFLGAFP